MERIRDQIIDAATSTSLVELAAEDGERIRNQVAHKFAQGHNNWLWNSLEDAISIQNPDAWRWIGDFIGNTEAVLFFNHREESVVFQIKEGYKVVYVLQAWGVLFEFYIANPTGEYLICFNHHDCLSAAGSAQSWLEGILSEIYRRLDVPARTLLIENFELKTLGRLVQFSCLYDPEQRKPFRLTFAGCHGLEWEIRNPNDDALTANIDHIFLGEGNHEQPASIATDKFIMNIDYHAFSIDKDW